MSDISSLKDIYAGTELGYLWNRTPQEKFYDEADGTEECPRCGKVADKDFDATHELNRGRFGNVTRGTFKVVYTCFSCRAQDRRLAKKIRFETTMHVNGVPDRLTRLQLEDWELGSDDFRTHRLKAYKTALGFMRQREAVFLVYTGGTGTGKSMLAAGCMRRALEKGRTAEWVASSKLIIELRTSYSQKTDSPLKSLDKWIDAGFLVIDELGISDAKDVYLLLQHIISERYDGSKATVITSNLTPDEFREQLGPRLVSRVSSSLFARVEMGDWPDWRESHHD